MSGNGFDTEGNRAVVGKGFEVGQSWVHVPVLLLTGCVILGGSHVLSEPQSLHQQNRNGNTEPRGLL